MDYRVLVTSGVTVVCAIFAHMHTSHREQTSYVTWIMEFAAGAVENATEKSSLTATSSERDGWNVSLVV